MLPRCPLEGSDLSLLLPNWRKIPCPLEDFLFLLVAHRWTLRQWSLDGAGRLDAVLLGKFPCLLEDADLALLIANRGKMRRLSLDDSGKFYWVLLGKVPCLDDSKLFLLIAHQREIRQWSLDGARGLDLVQLGLFPCLLEDADLVLLVANRGKMHQLSLDDSGKFYWVFYSDNSLVS